MLGQRQKNRIREWTESLQKQIHTYLAIGFDKGDEVILEKVERKLFLVFDMGIIGYLCKYRKINSKQTVGQM